MQLRLMKLGYSTKYKIHIKHINSEPTKNMDIKTVWQNRTDRPLKRSDGI